VDASSARCASPDCRSIERIAETYEQAYELILSKQSKQIGRLNAALFGETAGEDSRCVA